MSFFQSITFRASGDYLADGTKDDKDTSEYAHDRIRFVIRYAMCTVHGQSCTADGGPGIFLERCKWW
jgi:hypothetical protein